MDPFALLTGGAKFDRKRLKQAEQAYRGELTAAPAAAHPLPADLLLAGGSAPGSGRASKKRRTQQQQQQQQQHAGDRGDGETDGLDGGGGGGISVFGSSQPPGGARGGAVAAAGMAGTAAAAAAGAGDEGAAAALPEVHTRDPNEEANAIRRALRIKVAGSDAPCPLRCWEELGSRYKVGPRLRDALPTAGWQDPTPIQRQAVPALLEGRELLAIAPTGSGKTLAFLLPVVAALRHARNEGGDSWPEAPKALLLSPTHELAGQTARVLRKLLPGTKLRACLLNKATAAGSDFSKVDIIVANPLRLKTLVEEGKVDLTHLTHLIIDEADKLFELGFTEQIDALLAAATRPDVVRALFSATLPEKVEDLARTILRDPLRITVGERNTAAAVVRQRLQFVGREDGKLLTLRQLLAGGLTPPVLVFVSTKERAKLLHRELMYDGVRADSISADQSQAARAAAVANFRSGRTWVLIATDLLARGVDFLGVNTVVSYDFPHSTSDYIHRVGRTGRAGRPGDAITFFTEDDAPRLRSVANVIKAAGWEVPDWMLALKKGAQAPGKKRRPAGSGKSKRGALEGVTTQPELLGKRKGAPGSNGGGGKRKKGAAEGGGEGGHRQQKKQKDQQQRRKLGKGRADGGGGGGAGKAAKRMGGSGAGGGRKNGGGGGGGGKRGRKED